VSRATVAAALIVLGIAAGGAWLAGGQPTSRGSITIAAASDLQAVFPELITRFERDTGIKSTVSFGSSGSFFAQIQNGAPFDLFFSADIDYPRRLGTSGHADADSLYQYAIGRIVLWTRKDTGIDVRPGLTVLKDPRVRRIAIANPEYAPYGRAAVAALRAEKLYDAVRGKIVLGENLSQTAQLADSGNAEVAIIGSALAIGPVLRASGTYAEIPAAAHPPIEQGAVIVSASKNKDAARSFLAYVKQPDAKALLQRFGFAVPGESAR
jgi:molybdate transport system substrate-binding protein